MDTSNAHELDIRQLTVDEMDEVAGGSINASGLGKILVRTPLDAPLEFLYVYACGIPCEI